ncbi:Hypothetical predicted protein [Pelobates cultripes]|uniref:Uncharacterized protein n=1 Tax=Pelobates cultripes TaxID=61616 RepID=A0AAD1THY6_PELCU|nr:Hypothetical predicted protein [Pelobates cultripes]
MALSRNIDSIRLDRKSFMDTWSFKEDIQPNVESIPQPQKRSDDVRSLIYQLGKIMEKEVHVWWDIAALDFYVNSNIVPRGLRLFKRSAYKHHDLTLLKKWDQLLDKGSLLLKVFLINEKKKDLTQLDQEITALKASIRPLVESGEYVDLLEKMEKRVKDIEENIRETKRKKIMRDQADYRTQKQRNWKKETKPYHSPTKYRTEHRPEYQSYRDALVSPKTPTKYPSSNWTRNRQTYNRRQDDIPSRHHQRNNYRNTEYSHQGSHYHDQAQPAFQQPFRNRRPPDYQNNQSPVLRVPSSNHRRTDPTHHQTLHPHIPNISTENDFLEKRGRIPPRKFSVEDFRFPDVRKKRTIRDLEEETDQHEDHIQQKRKK